MEKLVQEKGVPLAEKVFQVLEESILQGEIKPGDVITEPKLSKALGVSRTPIREALQHLEQENLVQIGRTRARLFLELPEKTWK